MHWLAAYSFALGCGSGYITPYLPLLTHESGGLGLAAPEAVMVVARHVTTIARMTSEPRRGRGAEHRLRSCSWQD